MLVFGKSWGSGAFAAAARSRLEREQVLRRLTQGNEGWPGSWLIRLAPLAFGQPARLGVRPRLAAWGTVLAREFCESAAAVAAGAYLPTSQAHLLKRQSALVQRCLPVLLLRV